MVKEISADIEIFTFYEFSVLDHMDPNFQDFFFGLGSEILVVSKV